MEACELYTNLLVAKAKKEKKTGELAWIAYLQIPNNRLWTQSMHTRFTLVIAFLYSVFLIGLA